MIKNTTISLSSNSKQRIDAVNTIKYSLFLNSELPDIDINEYLIPKLMESCHNCCKELFENNSNVTRYHFFGSNEKYCKKSPLSYLDVDSTYKDKGYSFVSDTTFGSMILQHCVLNTYHAIVSDILNGASAESYYIVNTVQSSGVQSLIGRGAILIGNNNVTNLSDFTSSYDNAKKSSIASDFTKTSKSHLRNIPNISELFLVTDSESDFAKYYLQFAGLYSHINKISATQWRGFFRPVVKSTLPSLLEKLCTFSGKLSSNSSPNPTDILYHKYLIERIFNFDLINCLLQNIQEIERKTTYKFSGEDTLKFLCKCRKLPNAFSRPYFIQYAFEKFLTLPQSGIDFWHNHLYSNSNIFVSSLNGIPLTFQMSIWLQQFDYFCNYMADFVIPIYEWCFTDLLLKAIEQKEPDATHLYHLNVAMKQLAFYMKKNCNILENPYAANSPSGLITPQKRLPYDSLPLEYYENIFKVFFQENYDMDLNLKILGPDFFIKSKYTESKKDKIRNFYIELIKENYLIK